MTSQIQHLIGQAALSTTACYAGDNKEVGGIQVRQVFINRTNVPVGVIERTGLRYRVENTPNNYDGRFIIRTEYVIPRKSFDDLQRLFIYLEDQIDDYPDMKIIREAFNRDYNRDRFNQQTIMIDTAIDQNDLKNLRSIYISSRDLVLTIESSDVKVQHPFGKPNLAKERYNEMAKGHLGISTFLEIVDNEENVGVRYMYTAKRIFKITPVKDPQRESGIYFGVVEQVEMGEPLISTVRFDLEEGEERLGLYKTQEEALSAGDIRALRQEELARLQHSLAMQTAENQRIANEHRTAMEALKHAHSLEDTERKRALTEAETKIRQLDSDLEMLKREREREKNAWEYKLTELKAHYEAQKMRDADYYDRRSYERKESMEIIKYVPAVVTAAFGIWYLFSKQKTES